jgi:hypothetical protein
MQHGLNLTIGSFSTLGTLKVAIVAMLILVVRLNLLNCNDVRGLGLSIHVELRVCKREIALTTILTLKFSSFSLPQHGLAVRGHPRE